MRPQQLFDDLNQNFSGILYSGLVIKDEIRHATLGSGIDPDDHEALIMRLYFIAIDPEKDITYFINQYEEGKYLYFIKVDEGVWLFILSANQSFAKLHFYVKFLLSDNSLRFDEPDETRSHTTDERLNSAKRIQDMLLPNLDAVLKGLGTYELLYQPKDVVGGDFYWAHQDKDVTWIAVGDCTGHSMEGALASVSVMSILNQLYHRDMKPHWLIKGLHKSLSDMQNQSLTDGYGIGCELLVMRIDHKQGELTYSGTGMPLYHLNQGKLKIFHTKSANLDPARVIKYIRTRKLPLVRKDAILVHSDGIKDQLSPLGKRFSTRRLYQVLFADGTLRLDNLQQELNRHRGSEPQTDDIIALKLVI
mgnify:CR=1 FL=1